MLKGVGALLFNSFCHFDKVTDISPQILSKINITTLFLDIDNTLKRYGDREVSPEIAVWLDKMKQSGVQIILCSNNYKKTVKPFADKLGLEFVHFCLKPSPFGYIRARIKSGARRKNILVCGDQIFTDILGARLTFLKSALIEPIDTLNEAATVAFRRNLFKRAHNKNMSRKNPF